MKLAVVLVPGFELPPLPGGGQTEQRILAPPGYPMAAALLALLGQDPLAWTGPAAFAACAAGVTLASDETAYLLTPVRARDGAIVEEVACPALRRRGGLAELDEALEGEALQLLAGEPPVLLVGEPLTGPPALWAETLVGRRLDALPAGPPALLRRVIDASRGKLPGGALLFPNSPGRAGRWRPLREAWLGIGPGVLTGSSPLAAALAGALGLRLEPAPAGGEVAAAAAAAGSCEVAVAVCAETPASLEPLAAAEALVAVAPVATPGGALPLLELAWRGPAEALPERDPLRALALPGSGA